MIKVKNINSSRNNGNLLQIESKKKDNLMSDNTNFYKSKNNTSLKYYIDLSKNGNKTDPKNNFSNISNIKKHHTNKTINTDTSNNSMINNKSGTTNIISINTNVNTKANNTNNNSIENDKKISVIDKLQSTSNINKSNDINKNDNISDNNSNNILININNNKNNEKENNEEQKINTENNEKNEKKEIISNFSQKEKAIYLLIKSPMLPLRSQIILSRSTNNIKKVISKDEILRNFEKHLNEKIKDYQKKIVEYNHKITSHFTSSKIAEISLNFITNNCEMELCEIYNSLLFNKTDPHFVYYKAYIKTIYYIIDEKIEEENNNDGNLVVNEKKIVINLFNILKKKGYYTIKDYLYYLFISTINQDKEKSFIKNMDKIDEIITNEEPNLLDFGELPKMCKFIQFSFYLIKEIIDFGNLIKGTTNLKIETENFLELLKKNLEKFKNKYNI